MEDILQFIGGVDERDDPVSDFLEHVANGPLLTLAQIRQHGVHQGQTLYSHLLNVVLVADHAARLAGCSILERRILICAAVLHDLNKLDEQQRSIAKVARIDVVERFIEDFHLDKVLPEFRDHLETIRRLIGAHSAHLHQGADALLPFDEPLGRGRLKVLIELLRAADQSDVARTFDEADRKREKVLGHINAVCATQYRWEWHRLNEHRGVFSNLLHNAAADEFAEQLRAEPFLLYGAGTFYVVPASAPRSLAGDTHQRIAARLAAKLRKIKGGDADQFVSGSPTGTKINKAIFLTDIPVADAFDSAARAIQKRLYPESKIVESERKALGRVKGDVKPLLSDSGNLFSRDEAVMRTGELLRVAYNFLQAHCATLLKGKTRKFDDAWQPILAELEIPAHGAWAAVDALNDRAYVIARNVGLEFGDVLDRLARMCDRFANELQLREGGSAGASPLVEYVRSTVVSSALPVSKDAFLDHLKTYSDPGHDSCSLCGGQLPASQMMANDVPNKLVVSQFSNRNVAGAGDPKRNACPVCREQLFVDKMGFAPPQAKGFYLHVYPETFAPAALIEAFRRSFRELIEHDVRTMLFDTRTIAKEFDESRTLTLKFRQKATGLAIPSQSELVGNVLTLPIYPLGDNDTERYLFALHYAMLVQARFGQRAVLSQSLVPPVSASEMESVEVYFDDLPSSLAGLVPKNALVSAEAGELFEQLNDLKVAADRIGQGDALVGLARSLARGELGIFYAVHRELQKKNDGVANSLGGELAGRLVRIASRVRRQRTGEQSMSDTSPTAILQRLAELAWRKSIRGGSLAHTALIKPMDIAFHLLRQNTAKETSFLKLVATEEVLRHVERTSDFTMGAERAAAIGEWVAILFDDLLGKAYGGNRREFVRDEKYVKAAYTTLLREQLRIASLNKKKDQPPQAGVQE